MKNLIDKTAIQLDTTPGRKIVRDLNSFDVRPFSTTSVAPIDAIHRGQGHLMVGAYRGGLAYVDLDKQVVQPLVAAEKLHILGILNGRLANYDMVAVTYGIADGIGTVLRGRLTVPAGQVWYVHAVSIDAIKDATAGFTFQWRCSLWPDVVAVGGTPDADGQGYFAAPVAGAANTVILNETLFGATVAVPAVADTVLVSRMALPVLLRLPGGTVITLQSTTNTAVTAAATPVNLRLRGFVGKALVS